jgi:hypothetical protein
LTTTSAGDGVTTTWAMAARTVTVVFALAVPLAAVTVAAPGLRAVTTPPDTVAMVASLVVHATPTPVTGLPSASFSWAVNVTFSPATTAGVSGVSVICVTDGIPGSLGPPLHDAVVRAMVKIASVLIHEPARACTRMLHSTAEGNSRPAVSSWRVTHDARRGVTPSRDSPSKVQLPRQRSGS